MSDGIGVRRPRPARRRRAGRSASACSATPSWARRTRTATARCPTWPGRRRSGRGSSRSPAATRRRSPRPRGRFGFERYVTDWRELVADPEVELFDNSGPNNLHGEPTIAAAEAGKHVFCEKPLGRDRRRELRDLAARRSDRRQAHDARSTTASCPAVRLARADARGRRARRDPSLPRPLPAGVGRDRRATPGASTRTRRARARSATSART